MSVSSAPSPASDYEHVVTVGRRAVRQGLYRATLTDQVDGVEDTFTTPSAYVAGTIRVWWNGQKQTVSDITEVSSTTFSTSFTPPVGSGIEVEYRPA